MLYVGSMQALCRLGRQAYISYFIDIQTLTCFYVGFWQKLPKFLARNFCTEVYRFGVTKTATPYYIIYIPSYFLHIPPLPVGIILTLARITLFLCQSMYTHSLVIIEYFIAFKGYFVEIQAKIVNKSKKIEFFCSCFLFFIKFAACLPIGAFHPKDYIRYNPKKWFYTFYMQF